MANTLKNAGNKLANAFSFAVRNRGTVAKTVVAGYFLLSLPNAVEEAKTERAALPKDKQTSGMLVGLTAQNSLENAWQGVVKPTLSFTWDIAKGVYTGLTTKDQAPAQTKTPSPKP